jgi:hypothetical protein
MENMIFAGLARVYSFQNPDGGWGWWNDDASQIQMSGIVINGLLQIQQAGFSINNIVLSAALNYIVNTQKSDGSWEFPYYANNALESTAYIVRTLLFLSTPSISEVQAITKGLSQLEVLWADTSLRSPYAAALWYMGIADSAYSNPAIEADLINYIKSEKISIDGMIYWDNPSDLWYWSNLGNEVEMTAYSIQALAKDDYVNNFVIIRQAIDYLMERRNRWGWWSTADTSAAILTFTALQNLNASLNAMNFTGTIDILVNSTEIISLNLTTESHAPSDILVDISNSLTIGENIISIELDGEGELSYYFTSNQILRYQPAITLNPPAFEEDVMSIVVNLDDLPPNIYLADVEIKFTGIPEAIQVETEQYSEITEIIDDAYIWEFTFKDSLFDEVTEIGQIQFQGIAHYNCSTLDSTEEIDDQLFYWTSVPLWIDDDEFVSESDIDPQDVQARRSSGKIFSSIEAPRANNVPSVSAAGFTLEKSMNVQTSLHPGQIISFSVEIGNIGEMKQYLAIDEYIPAGTSFLGDSLEYSGSLDASSIILEQTGNRLNFFIPSFENGNLIIEYQVQVDQVKNSIIDGTRLWGMYEDIDLETAPLILSKIQKMYTLSNELFQDSISPLISSVDATQISTASAPAIAFTIDLFDAHGIDKIRIIFREDQVWQARTFYLSDQTGDIAVEIIGLSNIDHQISYYVEAWDQFGNIGTFDMRIIKILSTNVPYLQIGILLGAAIGIGALAYQFTIKKDETPDVVGAPSKSFLDEK